MKGDLRPPYLAGWERWLLGSACSFRHVSSCLALSPGQFPGPYADVHCDQPLASVSTPCSCSTSGEHLGTNGGTTEDSPSPAWAWELGTQLYDAEVGWGG